MPGWSIPAGDPRTPVRDPRPGSRRPRYTRRPSHSFKLQKQDGMVLTTVQCPSLSRSGSRTPDRAPRIPEIVTVELARTDDIFLYPWLLKMLCFRNSTTK